MAGIVATTTQWDALLQEDYVQEEIVDAINLATPFKDKLQRKGMTSGRERVYPVKVGASQGSGARAEGAVMPNYGAGDYQNAKVTAKYNYAPFKVTGQSLEFGTKKAFVEFGMQILKDTKEALRLFTGRQCWSDGSGKLALLNNGGALIAGTTTSPTNSAFGVAWGSLSTNNNFLIKKNMFVQFGTEDNGGQGYKITAVTATAITFTPGLAAQVADATAIYVLGSKDLEIEGWLKMVATSSFMTSVLSLANGIYHGIDRSLFPDWEGNVINAAAALSLTNVRQLRDTVYKRSEDDESNLCINSTEVVRDFEALLVPAQRFVPAQKLTAGYTVLEHDGLRVTKDSRAPAKAFNIMNTKCIAWAQTKDPHWLQDGSGIMRVVPGQDALEGLLKWYANLDADEPRRLGMLYNLTVNP